MNNKQPRPSDERRAALHASINVTPRISSLFDIGRYYKGAQTAYDEFQEAYQDPRRLDEAYVYGKRYAGFIIDVLPTHDYYNSPKHKANREKHNRQVEGLIKQLSNVVDRMDAEELQRKKERAEQERRNAEHHKQLEKRRYEDLQRRVLRQQQFSNQSQEGDSLATSAMSKLERLRMNLDTQQEGTGRVNGSASDTEQPRLRRDPSGEKPTRTSRYYLPPDEEEEESLPPPLPPPSLENGASPQPPPPPSYNQIFAAQRNGRYRPEAVMNQSIGLAATGEKPAKRRERIPMSKVQEMYLKDYRTYLQAGSISIHPLGTYQGRYASSTNGCTVISALVAAAHLTSRPMPISDNEIDSIIDQKCPPILRKIRGKLGLGDHALIIPSDVHDQLVDDKILHQKYFIGAAGGNVLDLNHMGEFLKLLVHGEDGKTTFAKSAATFFFREHVISLIKTPIGKGQVEFDLVDSLPSASNNGRSVGTRTRCKDVKALQVLMRWYTSRKFSPKDCAYIDRNEWDDMMADVDPRVFQGFVWAVQ
jgi:hypothetical protein